jgi:hypothetical protein
MTTFTLGSYLCLLGFAVVFLAGASLLAWLGEDEKPMEEKPMEMRFLRTKPGEGLVTCILRGMQLAREHGPTCCVHLGVPVVVTAEGQPEQHERRWRETAKLYQRGEVCKGA